MILALLGSYKINNANVMRNILCKVYFTVKFTLHLIVRALRRLLPKKVTLFLLTLSN
jgi:hypothetical protein